MQRGNGKTCIVTGAALGIGRACALRLAEEGARLALFDVLDDAGAALLAELQAQGTQAHYWHVDVASEHSVQTAIDAAAGRFGGVHVLVNNAGIASSAAPRRRSPIRGKAVATTGGGSTRSVGMGGGKRWQPTRQVASPPRRAR